MLSRSISSIFLLFLAMVFLAQCTVRPEKETTLPLARPPISAQAARFGPLADDPQEAITNTTSVTDTIVTNTIVLVPTPTLATLATVTPTVDPGVVEVAVVVTPTIAATVAPTESLPLTPTTAPPVEVLLLPTPTPTAVSIVLLPTPTPTPLLRPTSEPTSTEPSETVWLIPTPTPTIAPIALMTNTTTITETTPVSEVIADLPPTTAINSIPLPASYEVKGTYSSQTLYADNTTLEQQGDFAIVQVAAANAYGANHQYTLRTRRATGITDEINVFQLDNYILVGYTGGDWMLVRRDQGSNVVRAIQPLTDLAILFPRIITQAELVGPEEIEGTSSLRYHIDDPTGQAARLIQSLLSLSGEIQALRLDVWIAVPGGYVAAYDFQVELVGARVLAADGEEVRADQGVSWTYRLTPTTEPEPVQWPSDAPTPERFPIHGFALGEFPIPPNTTLLSLVGGVPDLISTLTPTAIDSFYRTELFTLGWTVEGEGALLRCSKGGTTFQLLISEDAAMNGTRISILPGE